MQKNKIKAAKRITALLMSVILLATSMPLIVAQAAGTGSYNPAPTWAKDDRGVSAYTDETGGIVVNFPAAQANTMYRAKKIEGYLLELVDLGANDTMHQEMVLLRKFVTPQGEAPYEAYFTPAEVEQAVSQQPQPAGLSADHRYNVTVTAVDSDQWFSKELYSIVSDVPRFVFDPEVYAPIAEGTYPMREMLRFESEANNQGNGTAYTLAADGSITDVGADTGKFQVGGPATQTGVEDPNSTTDVKSTAMRLRITAQPQAGTAQAYETEYSRETWDYSAAEEVWFWVDFSQASVQGVSFHLRSQSKKLETNQDGEIKETNYTLTDILRDGRHGQLFSTAACTLPNMQVQLQRSDGGWDRVAMQNGTLDLDHYKGYIRIPIEYFCSTAPTYADFDNQKVAAGFWDQVIDRGALDTQTLNHQKFKTYYEGFRFAERPMVDAQGTPIKDALLMQNRAFYSKGGFLGSEARYPTNGTEENATAMLAVGIKSAEYTDSNNTRRAYIENGLVQNRENGYKAAEDVKAAGFAFTACSTDSIDKALFLDNVMFYKANTESKWPENTLNGSPSNGVPVSTYYDQKQEISRAIFNACADLIESPDWSEFRAVTYITELIQAYRTSFQAEKLDPSFLEEAALTQTAAQLDMSQNWELYLRAKAACEKDGTIGKDNNGETDLVPELEETLEKLPDSAATLWMSENMQIVVKHIHKIYSKLNLGQLRNLGKDTEERLLKYFKYLDSGLLKNTVPVGQTLTDKPFIPFADFEQESYTVGERGWQLENDSKNYNQYDANHDGLDYRYTKNLISYTPNMFADFAGYSSDTGFIGGTTWSSADPTKDGIKKGLMQNGSWAKVTQNGFQGSKGVTGIIDNQRYVDKEGLYNVIGFTYMGAEENNFAALRQHNMSAENLGGLAKSIPLGDNPDPPLCLVAYVDFSELSDFRFTFTISTYQNTGHSGNYPTEDYDLDMGIDGNARYFFMLDPVTGEWMRANNPDLAYAFTSNSGYDTTDRGRVTLANYKGYLMIPLCHFKLGGELDVRGRMLDQNAEALNNIWRVSIGVAPNSNESAAKLDGKTYTVDNVGFSYDPTYYATEAAGRTDKNFDEIFQAKSLTAEQFEQIVSQIDPFGASAGELAADVQNAMAAFNTLSEYQKTRPSVKLAKATLDIYKAWAETGNIPAPDESYKTVALLTEAVNALPTQAKADGNVSGDKDLPYPGVVKRTDAAPTDLLANAYRVNYEAYGLTAAQCDEIVKMYENGYKRMSQNDRLALETAPANNGMTVKQALVNAYNAAMRCKNLEKHLAQLQAYGNQLHEVYGGVNSARPDLVKDTNGQIVSNFLVRKTFADGLSTLEKMDALDQQYADMTYCAKELLQKMPEFGASPTENAPSAVRRILKNTQIYTGIINQPNARFAGGIISTIDRYDALFTQTKAKIDAKQLLTQAELANLRTEVTAYLDMVQIYYSIGEMNATMQNILDLFSKVEINKPANLEFKLTETELQQTAAMNIPYLQDALRADETKAPYALQITSQNNGLAYGSHKADYTVILNGTSYTLTELANRQGRISLDDNTYTAEQPRALTIGVKMDKAPETPGAYTDILRVEVVDKDGNPMKDRYGNPVTNASMQIPVSYGAEDSFTVSIPASVDINWDFKAVTDVSYTVDCALRDDAAINVEVKQADTEALGVMAADGTTMTLPFTSQYFGTKESFTGVQTKAKPQNCPTMTVSQWNVPIGEYRTQLTYTVTYQPGGQTPPAP